MLPKVETLAAHTRNEMWRSDTARALDHPVLYWLTRGQGRFMMQCEMRGIGPNTAVFIPAHTLFSFEMFAQPQGMVLSLPNSDIAGYPVEPAVIKSVPTQEQHDLNLLIDTLSREMGELRTGQRRAVQAQVMMVAVWLDRMLTTQPKRGSGKSDKLLRRFSHVVSIGSRDGKSLGEFAADLNVTPTHLTRLTRGAIGKPASALVQERTINEACAALIHTNRPVQDIAKQLGFRSAAYFTRAFQAQTGQSPSAYRKTRQI
jgi:AraC-like DNA-binding protein